MNNPKNLIPLFFNKTSSTYDTVVNYTTFGKDKFWKKKILDYIKVGEYFLDLACGTGILTREIAQKFPLAKITGIDITPNYLEIAKKNSGMYKNIFYLQQDAENLDLNAKFDCIVSSYIPKYCKPDLLMEKCIDHLKPNGIIILHDFTYPKNKFVRSLWEFYFVILNLIGYLIPSWKKAFKELPKLIKQSNWLEHYSNEMKRRGFEVNHQFLTLQSSAILTGKKTMQF